MKRYDAHNADVVLDANGEYVTYADYAALRAAALTREECAAVCEKRAKMWQASNASPPKSRRARADEAQSLAAAIRAGGAA